METHSNYVYEEAVELIAEMLYEYLLNQNSETEESTSWKHYEN